MLAQELICLKILQNLAVHCPSDARREGLDDWPVIDWTPPAAVFVTTFVNGGTQWRVSIHQRLAPG